MTKNEFRNGFAILTACGMPPVPPHFIAAWEMILKDVSFSDYQSAILLLCKEKTTFYPGDNIPALILEEVKNVKEMHLPQADEQAILSLQREKLRHSILLESVKEFSSMQTFLDQCEAEIRHLQSKYIFPAELLL